MAAVVAPAPAKPSITLYTNHGCPYAHRAHITLRELGLDFDEVIIDLKAPREPWYLDINPRGLVPSLRYSDDAVKDQIITESAVVASFLANSTPSHLAPPVAGPNSAAAALKRARIHFFTDTWDSKIHSAFYPLLKTADDGERQTKARDWIAAVRKEIEPLLADAAPFFGGSAELTLAEVHTAPFVLRYYAVARAGLLPESVAAELDALPNFGRWARAVVSRASVLSVWDEGPVLEHMRGMVARMRA